jgi:hypothetical protein
MMLSVRLLRLPSIRWGHGQSGIDGARPRGYLLEPLDREVHHLVTVLEAFLADGRELRGSVDARRSTPRLAERPA